jgi:hypothetical protein
MYFIWWQFSPIAFRQLLNFIYVFFLLSTTHYQFFFLQPPNIFPTFLDFLMSFYYFISSRLFTPFPRLPCLFQKPNNSAFEMVMCTWYKLKWADHLFHATAWNPTFPPLHSEYSPCFWLGPLRPLLTSEVPLS